MKIKEKTNYLIKVTLKDNETIEREIVSSELAISLVKVFIASSLVKEVEVIKK